MKFRESWIFKVILAGIALVAVTIIGTVGFAIFWVWYWDTGRKEANVQAFKPQERPGAVALPFRSVIMDRKEPKLASRAEAQTFMNPIPPTRDSLEKGKQLYLTICSPCHGRLGQGAGVMGTVPNLAPLTDQAAKSLSDYLGVFTNLGPPQLSLNYVQSLPDGDIFYTITNGGYAIMPSFKDSLSPEQRWHLINYIKKGFGRDDLGE